MTKTIEERIEEAKEDLSWLRSVYTFVCASRPSARMQAQAERRLKHLLAVRDGRMVAVYASVSVTGDEGWIAHGLCGIDPTAALTLDHLEHGTGDALTILRGYAHVPSTQVHEVEADSEVPS